MEIKIEIITRPKYIGRINAAIWIYSNKDMCGKVATENMGLRFNVGIDPNIALHHFLIYLFAAIYRLCIYMSETLYVQW